MRHKFEIHLLEKRESGFSLVELIVAMAISGIVLGSIYSVFAIQNKSFKAQEQIVEMAENVRAAVDLMSREIGMAGYNPSGATFSGLEYDAAQIQIRADLNGNGSTSDANESIIYAYDSGQKKITRDTGGVIQPFAENIQEFTFSYLNEDGLTTTVTDEIRQMRLTVTGRTSKPDPDYPSNGGYRTYKLTTLVVPKNLDV